MNTKERMKEMGFDAQQLVYLVAMSQECFGPTDFDLEVRRYLEEMEKEET
jgi:hypothetical protein